MEPARFRYVPDHVGGGGGLEDDDGEESGGGCFLDVYVHGARGIHNICIYADQDVYARFSLTSSPGHAPALSTRVAARGGASPRFDERLPPLRVRRGRLGTDALKCEVLMRSCAESVLEDQLLGFTLVPLAQVAATDGAEMERREFSLSSTDLTHSPAGTVSLSLALRSGGGDPCIAGPSDRAAAEPSITSEVVILEPPAPPVDYLGIEFPDLNTAKENDDMAVQYLPFLHLGVAPFDAMEMVTSPRGENSMPVCSDGSKNASTTTTTSDDRAIDVSSSAATEKPHRHDGAHEATVSAPMCSGAPDTPTSNGGAASGKEKVGVFKSPMATGDVIDMEAEQSAMQRQIMEMYVKSMQQFTESLGAMKLPMELDGDGGAGVVVQRDEKKPEAEARKDGARVFYGSRAFF
ncbi:hypothetical protein CFC21_038197 [Triticum aestivum]|uniref:C2 domain-containing protein n=4 Tax=Triticum TaxID=4564 RepID=A0A9R0RZU2_TRITD|nr:uncharacterized protein LOC123059398 [Triticum aestivum]KAF7026059.1 hypothetical protein CFC21_038197 [Triticum aestivum]VAH69376.1 unnamed protein product [Triticum turgidum subsp. durum]